jgi:hypothetical protein
MGVHFPWMPHSINVWLASKLVATKWKYTRHYQGIALCRWNTDAWRQLTLKSLLLLHICGKKLTTPHINDMNTFQKSTCHCYQGANFNTVSAGSKKHLYYVQPWKVWIKNENTGHTSIWLTMVFIHKTLHQTTQDLFHCENTQPFPLLWEKGFWHS